MSSLCGVISSSISDTCYLPCPSLIFYLDSFLAEKWLSIFNYSAQMFQMQKVKYFLKNLLKKLKQCKKKVSVILKFGWILS